MLLVAHPAANRGDRMWLFTPGVSDTDMVPDNAVAAVVEPVVEVAGTIQMPGSKSMTNRALLLAALAAGESDLTNALDCDDSRYMVQALSALGATVDVSGCPWKVHVSGCDGRFSVESASLYLGNAGTATRFLTGALSAMGGCYVVDGDERMRERPIRDLVRALSALGAEIKAPSGCPPVRIGPRRAEGGEITMPGNVSSQFLSSVLMAAPLFKHRTRVRIQGTFVSRPYVELTRQAMSAFGVRTRVTEGRDDCEPVFEVSPGRYTAREYYIEGDASAASYFYAAAAVTGSTVRVEGVGRLSRQGDIRCADVLASMGCRVTKEELAVTVTGGLLRGVDVDCSDIPDVVPTLSVVALFARGRTRLRGVEHLRHKESDRIAAVASELRKLGGVVSELRDGLEISGSVGQSGSALSGNEIDTWGDHRIAMAFSIAGLVLPGVVVLHPKVVSKSYPDFFRALSSLGARISWRLADGTSLLVEPEGCGS